MSRLAAIRRDRRKRNATFAGVCGRHWLIVGRVCVGAHRQVALCSQVLCAQRANRNDVTAAVSGAWLPAHGPHGLGGKPDSRRQAAPDAHMRHINGVRPFRHQHLTARSARTQLPCAHSHQQARQHLPRWRRRMHAAHAAVRCFVLQLLVTAVAAPMSHCRVLGRHHVCIQAGTATAAARGRCGGGARRALSPVPPVRLLRTLWRGLQDVLRLRLHAWDAADRQLRVQQLCCACQTGMHATQRQLLLLPQSQRQQRLVSSSACRAHNLNSGRQRDTVQSRQCT
mmetsp:Transcript_45030/g.134387  ORF Transcript_45030/g.134387 Transcript_45030/m.134387 type:complete len:283 (+) Transcript_45030:1305-2153(+)